MNVIQTILDYNKSKESGGKTDITKSDIISALGYTPISELEKGANSGIAELDDNGKVLTSELPSYVDDVEEFNNLAELQKHTGEASKIYITLDDNKCYRWGGTAYVEISSSITLGETSGTAFRGDLGKEAYDKSHIHSNKEVIDSITSEDITNWNNKSDFDGKYTSLTDTPTIPTVTNDLTNELKANYDLAYTQTHTHSNKKLLDKLSLNKDNKLLYNGDKVDSDVDLTAIIDDSTIADKTTWSSNKINTTIPKTWVGTKADYEQIKDTLENGTIVYITDDESVILLDKTEITKMKLTDDEFKRQINTLYDINNGSTLSIETDSKTAYTKTVPTGAKLMSVKSVGGKSVVWNQLCNATNSNNYFINNNDGTITVKSGANDYFSINGKVFARFVSGHKYLALLRGVTSTPELYLRVDDVSGQMWIATYKGSLFTANDTYEKPIYIRAYQYSGEDVNVIPQIFDLTQMFGAGNEPTTVEEFEKMFPADYYPYNASEIISAGTESVVVQGRNLFDCYGFSCITILNVNAERKLTNDRGTTISTIEPINRVIATQAQASNSDNVISDNNGYFCIGVKGMKLSKSYVFSFDFTPTKMLLESNKLAFLVNGRLLQDTITIGDLNVKKRISTPINYSAVDDREYIEIRLGGMSGIFENFQLDEGSTATAYTPYYTPISYTIPEAIRNLPGYGWSAGTARNYVDYENKRYVQCVSSVDLGTLTWIVSPTGKVSFQTSQVTGQKLTKNYSVAPNFMCLKYSTKTQDDLWGKPNVIGITAAAKVDGFVYVNDTSYTDATAFKQAMSGVILYYELANPIVTDISTLIDDDFLRNIEVEAGGSVTFKNSNGDNYHIPVPSELSYTVKFNSNASKEYVDSELAKKANKTDIPTKLPANGGNADTVNNHTVLSDVPIDAKFTDTITSIEDSSTTSTTSTWSAQKINDTITNSKNARVILSMGRDIVEAETKTAELVSLDGAYLYWSSQAGTNNYVFGIILYVYNKWTMIPIAQSSEDASTGVSFSITDNTITMTKHNTGSTPTAGGVFALGPTLI